MKENKKVVVFEKANGIAIGCLLLYKERGDSVQFFLFDAVDESSPYIDDEEPKYNLLGPDGVVDTFEKATQLAAGHIYLSHDPRSIILGNFIDYRITFDGRRSFQEIEVDAIIHIINTRLKEYLKKLMGGEKLDNEFIFESDEKGA